MELEVIATAALVALGKDIAVAFSKSVRGWFKRHWENHSEIVQAEALENTINYLQLLKKKFAETSECLSADEVQVIEESVRSPEASKLLEKTVLLAGATDNDDRHEILSELIRKRFQADADDMVALSGSAACDVVNSLASRHIRILGLAVRLFNLRPVNLPKCNSQEEYDDLVLSWLTPIEMLVQGCETFSWYDIEHLQGLGCIWINIMPHRFSNLIREILPPDGMKVPMDKIEALPWWASMNQIFENGLKRINLTLKGKLIGILYHDSAVSGKTDIDWEQTGKTGPSN